MNRLQFRDFAFPHNPKTLQVAYSRNFKVFRPPLREAVLQHLGRDFRVVTGRGEFYGEDAFPQFLRLTKQFESEQRGVLVLPGFEPFYAWFRSLKLIGEAGTGVLEYAFEFWELPAEPVEAASLTQSRYIPAEGETLWSISAATGVSVERLLALNPYIRNPFDLTPGREVALV